jgi:hypothetical protein
MRGASLLMTETLALVVVVGAAVGLMLFQRVAARLATFEALWPPDERVDEMDLEPDEPRS